MIQKEDKLGMDEDLSLAFITTVRDDTLLQGPANVMGPII